MRKYKIWCSDWKKEQAFYCEAVDILVACDMFENAAEQYGWIVKNVIVEDLGPLLEYDKQKVCDWILKMDVDDFYCLTCALSDNFEFTGLPLFYSCEVCGNEHEDFCEGDCSCCEKFFKEHYK